MCLNTGYPCECLTTGNQCEPCRMTAKDKDTEETSLSNNVSIAGQADVSQSELDQSLSVSGVVKDRVRNWGWLVSGIIALNVLFLGCALVSGTAYNKVAIGSADMQIYLIILLLLTLIWMLQYSIYTFRDDQAVLYQDGHAGPIWLRGGLVLFGVLSLIMDIFKIASYVGYLHCDSAVKVAFPVVQAVFILAQTCFLWIHAKDCMQLQRNITRCGLMLMFSTNLVMWMMLVTEESVHQTSIPDYTNTTTKLSARSIYMRASYGDDKCKCSHSSCSMFKKAYYYLYPFNIEYSLFASAMAYVMWKNVGRIADEHNHHSAKFCLKGIFLGPITGILLVLAGLTTFIVYEIDVEKEDYKRRDEALMMYFIMNVVIMSLMSVATVVGCAIYRLDQREHVSEKNPTRSLDVGLLVGASMGQFIISYFTIVAVVATGAKGHLNAINLALAILTVVQLGLQNFFLIEGLHREPFHETHPVSVFTNPYVLQASKELSSLEGSDMDTKPSPEFTPHIQPGHIPPTEHTTEHRLKLSWKRRVLKEVCSFLLLANIILWIMPAFGARPHFDHSVETDFYQFTMWAAVVNIGLPFGIFYRMHSVASLFEVYVNS
ncbi:proton channel OTOP2-like [Lampris incognitus]|uniref:proton channel OTOP2-like n=1 Tax=Lampris incognitus TaxID=2546036 RepID=UPI0024B59CEA|nr:proton channel OTOP2-like [Lampris incognitus]